VPGIRLGIGNYAGRNMSIFNFLKKDKPQDRYKDKPFLKLVDSFVLKCIGKLDPSQEYLLKKMEPKLQGSYNLTGSWDEIVVSQLEFGPDIEEAICGLWVKNQAIAKENGVELSPIEFTEMFVANNVTNT